MPYYLASYDEFEGEHYIDRDEPFATLDLAIAAANARQPKYVNSLTDHIDVMDETEHVVWHGHPR